MHAGRHLAYGDASTGHFNYSTLPNFYAGAIAPDVTQTAEYSQQNDTDDPEWILKVQAHIIISVKISSSSIFL